MTGVGAFTHKNSNLRVKVFVLLDLSELFLNLHFGLRFLLGSEDSVLLRSQ